MKNKKSELWWLKSPERRELDEFRRKVYNSSRWRKTRLHILANEGAFCEECGRMANEVDHIKPLSEIMRSGELELIYDPINLRSLCKRCHSQKSYTEGLGKLNKKTNPQTSKK